MPQGKPDYYWEKHGIKAKGKPYRYQIWIDHDWLGEAENPNSPEHALRVVDRLKMQPFQLHKYNAPHERIRLHKKMLIRMFIQIGRCKREIEKEDYQIYSVNRAGVPSHDARKKEWLCKRTCLVATPCPQLLEKHSIYFRRVQYFSVRAFNFLVDLDPRKYSYLLNCYLKRLLLFDPPTPFEVERITAIIESKGGWRKIQCQESTTSAGDLTGTSRDS